MVPTCVIQHGAVDARNVCSLRVCQTANGDTHVTSELQNELDIVMYHAVGKKQL